MPVERTLWGDERDLNHRCDRSRRSVAPKVKIDQTAIENSSTEYRLFQFCIWKWLWHCLLCSPRMPSTTKLNKPGMLGLLLAVRASAIVALTQRGSLLPRSLRPSSTLRHMVTSPTLC